MVNELDGGGPFGPVVNETQIVFYPYRPDGEAGWAFLVLFAIGVLGHVGSKERHSATTDAQKHMKIRPMSDRLSFRTCRFSDPRPCSAATIYMSLGRIIIALDLRRHTPISPRLTAFFYVVVDIGCFVTQVFGAVMPASGDPNGIKMAKTLTVSGLIVQLAVITPFLLSCWHSHRCAQREASVLKATRAGIQWRKYYLMTYAVASLMFARSLIRGIEYLQGEDGFVMTHEIFLYLFDAVPMVVIMALYLWIHPGRLVRDVSRIKEYTWPDESNMMLERR
ncbi:Protein RTM1 [Colletotrichum shisoi]|uniref:Protein RTM1 n=1 Tax=Colletotrichum shisoi TaxID=2078593 RepID=A0A5Q4BSS7_9PEZI|nr:Protein RTM1 [Colletotrichum shisoi]